MKAASCLHDLGVNDEKTIAKKVVAAAGKEATAAESSKAIVTKAAE